MKDYKKIYIENFFFWQEAYEQLSRRNKQLLEEIEQLKEKIKDLEKIIMNNY